MPDTTPVTTETPTLPDTGTGVEGVGTLAWDGDAITVASPSGGEALTLRHSFAAIRRYERQCVSEYPGASERQSVLALLENSTSTTGAAMFLSAFSEARLTDEDAFAWYGRLGHHRVYQAAALVVDRMLTYGGFVKAAGTQPEGHPPDAVPPA